MTAEEWEICQDPFRMTQLHEKLRSERKWGLLAAACWRRALPHLRDKPDLLQIPDLLAIIDVNEAHAEKRPLPDTEWADADCFVLHPLDAEERALGCFWSEVEEEQRQEAAAQAALIRDIFGNPFHPVIFDPALRTTVVTFLAQAAYAERDLPSGHLDPDRLTVLADALEEAGCVKHRILAHLRGPGPHARGCFAVDLVLAKE